MGNNTSQPEGKPASGEGHPHPHRRPSIKIGNPTNQQRPQPSRLPVLPHHRTAAQAGSISPVGPLSPSGTHPPGSPRRRKSLELPDLIRLSLTPAASPHPDVAAKVVSPPVLAQYERTGGRLSPLGVVIANNPALVGGDAEDAATPTTSPPASGSKRISLMSGTRAKSPQSGIGSGGSNSRAGSMDGMPIPGASPTRRRKSPTRAQQQLDTAPGDNPYFPSVERERIGRMGQVGTSASTSSAPPPATPGLPNYANSPSERSGTSTHTEDISPSIKAPDGSRDRLIAPTNPASSGRQPSPAKPAPAVVSREITPNSPRSEAAPRAHQHPPSEYVAVGQQVPLRPHDVVLSSLPKGSSPRKEMMMLSPHDTQHRNETASIPDESTIPTPTAGITSTFASRATAPTASKSTGPTESANRIQPAAAAKREEGTKKSAEDDNGLVPTLVTWTGGGKDVYVTGTFADGGWKNRIRMERSTHDFSLMLNLPPGTHRLKFIVDDHWRCSNDLQTATDGDGNLVNWLEVESETARRGADEDWAIQEWAKKITSAAAVDDDDPRLWTSEIPAALINFQITEERALSDPPDDLPRSQLTSYRQSQQTLLSSVPVPPTLPRHLEKVILNTTAKELEGTVGGTGGDDNSILPVPNHVVLQHLTASAIKNGTLAVGTTTRYKRKYISTIFFKSVGEY